MCIRDRDSTITKALISHLQFDLKLRLRSKTMIRTKLDTSAKTIGSKVYGVIKELIILLIV